MVSSARDHGEKTQEEATDDRGRRAGHLELPDL
jgi:hypothetical protein